MEDTKKTVLAGNGEKDVPRAVYDGVLTIDTDIDDITKENVDVVCVVIKSTVVNGEGSTIVHSLLEKGINVIQEHPIDIDDYIMGIKIAQKNCCMYRLNTFYPQLSNVKQFIFLAGKLRKKTTCNILMRNVVCMCFSRL